MSKVTSENKRLKGKQKRIAEANANKTSTKEQPKQKSANILNYGKCITCIHFPHKLNGITQPCKITNIYVTRKHESCPKNAYKCKFES